MIEFFTYEEFDKLRIKTGSYWNLGISRWPYLESCLNILKEIPLSPEQVLEIGSLGAQLVKGSNTLDIPNNIWAPETKTLTYIHDLKKRPWPIPNRKYEILIALRVWHHLWPYEKECLKEAFRVSRRVLIVAPETYPNGRGIKTRDFEEWTRGIYQEHKLVFGEDTWLHYWVQDEKIYF